MGLRRARKSEEINASSMADIAFLLLIFFLITTSISGEEGVSFVLPPKKDDEQKVERNDRNVFKVILNSSNKILVEDEEMQIKSLKMEAKAFISNFGANPKYSDNPGEAVVAFRTDRGTDYKFFVQALHELKAAYQELWAEEAGLTVEEFLALDLVNNPDDIRLYNKVKEKYPFRLSKADPTNFVGK